MVYWAYEELSGAMDRGKPKKSAPDSMESRLARNAWGTFPKVIGAVLILTGVAFIVLSWSFGAGGVVSLESAVSLVGQMAGLPFVLVGAVLWRNGRKINQKFYKGF